MQRVERRLADREDPAVRTLAERDYLLAVADETRLGALRFRWMGNETFRSPTRAGVAALIELGRLLPSAFSATRKPTKISSSSSHPAPPSFAGGRRPR